MYIALHAQWHSNYLKCKAYRKFDKVMVRLKVIKRVLILLILIAVATITYLNYSRIRKSIPFLKFFSPDDWNEKDLANRGLLLNTTGCIVPNFDPFHDSTRRMTKTLPGLTCPESGGLTYTEGNVVRINYTVARTFYKDEVEYCEYLMIYRPVSAWNPDFQFKYNDTILRDLVRA